NKCSFCASIARLPRKERPCAYRYDPSRATRAHQTGTQSRAPQGGHDLHNQSSVGGNFHTHPLAALELYLNPCRTSKRRCIDLPNGWVGVSYCAANVTSS